MFERASRLKLRFQTKQGLLSVEDLWTLALSTLNTMYQNLRKSIKESSEDSLLDEVSKVDEQTLLQIDIIKHIVSVRKAENLAATLSAAQKESNQKIMELIKAKEDEALKNLPLEELRKLLVAV